MKLHLISPKGIRNYNQFFNSNNLNISYFYPAGGIVDIKNIGMVYFGLKSGRLYFNILTKEVISFGQTDKHADSYWKIIKNPVNNLWIQERTYNYWKTLGNNILDSDWFKNNIDIRNVTNLAGVYANYPILENES